MRQNLFEVHDVDVLVREVKEIRLQRTTGQHAEFKGANGGVLFRRPLWGRHEVRNSGKHAIRQRAASALASSKARRQSGGRKVRLKWDRPPKPEGSLLLAVPSGSCRTLSGHHNRCGPDTLLLHQREQSGGVLGM